MNDASVVITASAIKARLNTRGDLPIADFAKEVFRLADSHDCGYMCGSDDEMFRGGCGALLLLCEGEERARVEVELRMLRGLAAAMQGLPIDMSALIPDGFEAIGLMGIFKDRNS